MTESPQDGIKRLEIRKYPNRRYYDTTHSRHVTLEEIYTLIRDGYEVQVIDSKSGQDITAKVLAQIIIELDTSKLGVFPVSLLHRLLRSNEQMLTEFVQRYFNQPLAAFLDSQRNFEHSLRNAMGLPSTPPTVADWARMMWGSFNPALWEGNKPRPAGSPAAAPPPGAPAAPAPPSQPAPAPAEAELRGALDQLRQQVQLLQKQLEERDRAGANKARRKGR